MERCNDAGVCKASLNKGKSVSLGLFICSMFGGLRIAFWNRTKKRRAHTVSV